MKKVLVSLIAGLACMLPVSGVFATEETTLSDDIYSFQAEIDGELYQFPMSFEDFTAKGWEYDGDAAQTLEPDAYTAAEVFKKGEERIYTSIYNRGMNTAPYSECKIGGFSVDSFLTQNGQTTVKLPKGIEFGVSTLDDVKAAYGDPSDLYDGELYTSLTYEYEAYQDVEIKVSKETNVVSEIDLKNLVQEEDDKQAENVSSEPTEEVKSYQAPTELGDDLTKFIVEYDGALYQLPAPVSEFEKNGWKIKEESSEMVVKGKSFGWVVLMKNNQELKAIANNYGNNATAIQNCFVTSVRGDDNSTNMPITVQKGITRGMTKADLEKALEGVNYEFEESSSFEYYKVTGPESKLDYVEILVRKDTEVVQSIEVKYSPKELGK